MSAPTSVAAYARGLINLLQQASSGATPNECAGFIQPAVELERFLGCNFRQVKNDTTAALAAGNNLSVQVPAGEFWIMRAGSVTVSHGAGATATDVAVVMFPGESPAQGVLITDVFDSVSAAAEVSGALIDLPGLIVTPGTTFRVISGPVAGAVSADLRLLVDVLT